MATVFSEKVFKTFEQQFAPFLEELDIPSTIFKYQDIEINDTQYLELLEAVARNTNPYIGLDMGETLSAEDLGVVGHAMAASATIGDALILFSKYIYVFAQANNIRMDIGENKVICTYSIDILQPNQHRQDVEFALSYLMHIICSLSQKQFRPNLVEFSHSRFADSKRHLKVFDCEVKFEQHANRIHFNKRILNAPIVTADPGLLTALKFYLDDRLKVRSEDKNLLAKTRHLISVSLSNDAPDMKKIASQMGMSIRSLQRKLGEKNIIFSELVDSIRQTIAVDYIHNTDIHLTDVALMLGYAELSSFSRAFKRWYGVSPQQARESNDHTLLLL